MKPESERDREAAKKQPRSDREAYGPTRNDQSSEGKNPPSKVHNLREAIGSNEQWGLLPKKLQEIMNSSQDKEFPPEYREVIAEYYKRLGEIILKEEN
jgi:hypothetical protein